MNDGRVDGQQILSPSLIKQLTGHQVPDPGDADSFYGYGMTVFKLKDIEFVGHGGFSRGYGSMVQMAPSRKFAVIVLTNKSGETMRRSLNKATELGLGIKTDSPPQTTAVAPPASSEMNDYVGSYSHAPLTWEVFIKDGKLALKLEGKEYLLTRSGDKKFTYGDQNEEELVFVPGKSGRIDFVFTGLYSAKRVGAPKSE
jgi:hypothetical protein